jgi:hypothetical protein
MCSVHVHLTVRTSLIYVRRSRYDSHTSVWILDAECGTSDTKSMHYAFAGTVSMTMGVIFPSGGDGHCAQL